MDVTQGSDTLITIISSGTMNYCIAVSDLCCIRRRKAEIAEYDTTPVCMILRGHTRMPGKQYDVMTEVEKHRHGASAYEASAACNKYSHYAVSLVLGTAA